MWFFFLIHYNFLFTDLKTGYFLSYNPCLVTKKILFIIQFYFTFLLTEFPLPLDDFGTPGLPDSETSPVLVSLHSTFTRRRKKDTGKLTNTRSCSPTLTWERVHFFVEIHCLFTCPETHQNFQTLLFNLWTLGVCSRSKGEFFRQFKTSRHSIVRFLDSSFVNSS